MWIGPGPDLPNLEHWGSHGLTSSFLQRVACECDVFVAMGTSDANATSVLESMASGFPVACTPQSGYHGAPSIIELSTWDMVHNVEVLRRLQAMPSAELAALGNDGRELARTRYSWDRFETRLKHVVRNILDGKEECG